MIAICAIYVILGTAMEELSMILLTVPVFFPLVVHLGFDPVWFGVIIVVVVRSDGGDDAQQQQSRDNQASVGRSGTLLHNNRLDIHDGGDVATGQGRRGGQAESGSESSEFGHDHAPYFFEGCQSDSIEATVAQTPDLEKRVCSSPPAGSGPLLHIGQQLAGGSVPSPHAFGGTVAGMRR